MSGIFGKHCRAVAELENGLRDKTEEKIPNYLKIPFYFRLPITENRLFYCKNIVWYRGKFSDNYFVID